MGAQARLEHPWSTPYTAVPSSLGCRLSELFVRRMGKDGEVKMVPYVQAWLWPSVTLAGASSLCFGVYIGKITNSHEWKEIFLDYCHHKRTQYSPNPLDKIARMCMNILKIAPK